MEVYALRFPGGAFLNCMSHAKGAEQAKVSCELASFGFDPARPIHVWRFHPRPVDVIDRTVVVTEAEANAIFAKEGKAPHRAVEARFVRSLKTSEGRFEETLSIEPGQLQMLMLTQASQLACAVDGRPMHFLLPAPAGAKAETVRADHAIAPDVIARREGYVLPDGKRSAVLFEPSSSPETSRHTEKELRRTIQGVELLRSFSLSCEHNNQNSAEADPEALLLRASMGMEKVVGFACAGFEAKNLGTLQLAVKLQSPHYGHYTTQRPGCFAGFVVDYHTPRGYTRRIRFPVVPASSSMSDRPWWGQFGQNAAEPTYLVPLQLSETMSLDLGRYSPADWDGRAVWSIHLESCGLGTGIEVRVMGNGRPGARLARMPESQQSPNSPNAAGDFQDIKILRHEGCVKSSAQGIVVPAGGLIEATGLGVVRWRVDRTAASKNAELLIHYQLSTGQWHLQKIPLSKKVAAGSHATFDIDFRQYAPKDWKGHCRCQLVGDGVTAEIVGNTQSQMF